MFDCAKEGMEKINGRVILASGSPRRKEIMEQQLGFKNIEVVPSDFPETLSKEQYASFEYPIQTALRKALDVYKSEVNANVSPSLLIAADTVIDLNGTIMEKPRSVDHHIAMLEQLRDSQEPHKVYTGIAAIIPYEKPVHPGYALNHALGITEVTFRKNITDKEIHSYVASGEAFDAAGGYKIQGEGAKFVEKIEGDKYNVIGLPVEETKKLILNTFNEARDHYDDDYDDEFGSDDEHVVSYI